jgi:hypothetical protein
VALNFLFMTALRTHSPTKVDFKTAGYVLDAAKTVRGVKDVYLGVYRYSQTHSDAIFEQNSFLSIVKMLKETQVKLEFVCLSDAPFDAETYRYARLYFDVLKEAREITRSLRTENIDWSATPLRYRELLNTAVELFDAIEVCTSQLEKKLAELDAPFAEKSRFLTRVSGEKLWSDRNKNYEYLV